MYEWMSATRKAGERLLSKEGDGPYRRQVSTCSAAGFVGLIECSVYSA